MARSSSRPSLLLRFASLASRIAVGSIVFTALGALNAKDAQAFCRTTTVSVTADYDPVNGCWAQGYVLWWRNACVGYSVDRAASRQVTLTQAEQMMATAFAKWTGTACASHSGSGSRVSIDVRDEGPAECAAVQYNQTQGNQHVIFFHDDVWPYHDSANTLALTTVTFDPTTGELYDADMEINATVPLALTDPIPEDGYDFQSIVTHESGHFLGLAHSGDVRATMYAHYNPGTTSMRNLTEDDVSGICAAYPPDGTRTTSVGSPIAADACDPTPRHGYSTTCAQPSQGCLHMSVGPARPPDSGVVVLAVSTLLFTCLRRRRRER